MKISGTGGAIGTVRALGDAFRKSHPDVKIVIPPSLGSSGAIKALLAGKLDIAVSARPLNPEEWGKGCRETLYARTPFVFAVHPKTRRTAVTRDDLVRIFEGTMTSWEDGSRIRLVLRPPGDSDVGVLKGLFPGMAPAVDKAMRRDGMIVEMTDQDAVDAIERIPGALGATTLAVIHSEKRKVRVLSLDGVAPDLSSAADGSYPYAKEFFMVVGESPSPSDVLSGARSPQARRNEAADVYFVGSRDARPASLHRSVVKAFAEKTGLPSRKGISRPSPGS